MINTRGTKREVVGTIVSNKMDKTVVVVAERLVQHPLYKKFIRRRHRFVAHDTGNECGIGDRVLITEARPLSKTKRWRVSKIIAKAV
ncbi:MAG: 30S ribosomal protein S17 [Desulfatitalea sp. BRH_c12]|jgi:small subunit ribosomal protein S17|nr:MAG: 30S ribosomal protein S17 [Desulfatitalea sp. BRH_c12]